MNITFGELPAARTTSGAWVEEALALRTNPGQWAHFPEFDSRPYAHRASFTQSVRSGRIKAFRSGQFEARVIKGQVWARYVGESA